MSSVLFKILKKDPRKKVNNGVRKSIDDFKLDNVVKSKGDRNKMLYKPKLSN